GSRTSVETMSVPRRYHANQMFTGSAGRSATGSKSSSSGESLARTASRPSAGAGSIIKRSPSLDKAPNPNDKRGGGGEPCRCGDDGDRRAPPASEATAAEPIPA